MARHRRLSWTVESLRSREDRCAGWVARAPRGPLRRIAHHRWMVWHYRRLDVEALEMRRRAPSWAGVGR